MHKPTNSNLTISHGLFQQSVNITDQSVGQIFPAHAQKLLC